MSATEAQQGVQYIQLGRSPRHKQKRALDPTTRILGAICAAYVLLESEQRDLYQEMGYTKADRVELSEELARSLLASGVPGVSQEELTAFLSVEELAEFLYELLSGMMGEQVIATFKDRYERRRNTSTHTESSPAVSEVSPDEWAGRPGDQPGRTRRTAGRVGSHYRRTMSEPFLLI